jgi:cytochrome c-type biogenesis protein CcsB
MRNLLFNIARTLHVPLLLGSYLIFAAAFVVGLVYLWEERQMKSKHPTRLTFQLPSLTGLDALISKLIMIGFPLLTLGIILGGVWAKQAWGRFWGWDPKETWAFITWLVYDAYLFIHFAAGWRGRKTTYLSLAGFAFVLFTYVGVNYMSPLHRFLTGTGR